MVFLVFYITTGLPALDDSIYEDLDGKYEIQNPLKSLLDLVFGHNHGYYSVPHGYFLQSQKYICAFLVEGNHYGVQ